MTTAVDDRRQLLLDSLFDVGYHDGHVEVDWPYLNLAALGKHRTSTTASRLDIAAFHDERRRDWETSAVVCDLQTPISIQDAQSSRKRSQILFEATASPNVILGDSGRIDLWLGCESTAPELVQGIELNQQSLRRAFSDHKDRLDRESLSRLRGGQRFLFDRVYDARRDELAGFLHVGLEQAIKALRKRLGRISKRDREAFELSLSHVAMALLAARIMEDKDFFDDSPATNARKLLTKAESESNGFFRHVIQVDLANLDNQLGRRAVNEILPNILAHLTGPACFSLITPDMLGDLYERALIANGHAERSVDIKGIHYTPLSLANHILRRIPIEEIEPSRRCVADLACGSGSFLMAATARLRGAFDANEADAEGSVLEHVSSRVIGNDKDNIALLVTRMRYLLHHWIETGSPDDVPTPQLLELDGLALRTSDFGGVRPTVVVGNPPFNPSSTASEFLLKAIEVLAPGGFLGLIMPAAFLTMRRNRSPNARYELLKECDLIEVWDMPQGTVGISARHSPCVLIARKHKSQLPSPALFKSGQSTRDDAVSEFRDHLRSTWSFVADGLPGTNPVHWSEDPYLVSQSNPNSLCRIIASPIDRIWRTVNSDSTLEDICGDNIVPGIAAYNDEAVFSNQHLGKPFVPYLQHQSRLQPFFLIEKDWREAPGIRGAYVDPTDAKRPRKQYSGLFEGPKVITTASSNKNAATQIVAAFDESGVYPEDHFRCLGLGESGSEQSAELLQAYSEVQVLLWLVAILNSPIGQAWIAVTSSPRGLTNESLKSLPLPQKFDSRIPELMEAIRSVPRPTQTGNAPAWTHWSTRRLGTPGTDFATIAGQLNRAVFCSYGLEHDHFLEVSRYLGSMTDPWVNDDADAHIVQHSERRIRGTVLSVDSTAQQVTVQMRRYCSDSITIPLPKDFPGWALKADTEFTCLAPRDDRDPKSVQQNPWLLRDFRPLPYAYLSTEQLESVVLQATDLE